ncbi:methylated-DNA-(protein)-cysteine S-methyltransferase [Shewanella sediminis HAW-EB3]|uniref:Methylated-DNA-(Protein)-cysteine S-methyltransferase n=1 Tax=Shewanella sediminis (strain HAW-EB3) TaxID=425104 RepID=A8FUT9_SHESH|nr:methylated-DNA-(protein)-cysteine S-methyltransferase [Shewanella sediminis HAW-EB3]
MLQKETGDQVSVQQTHSPMEKIWFIVGMIPEGTVTSYGKVADLAGLPGRARYVSKALKSAPQEMNLPWFRVINSQGRISFKENSQPYQAQMELLRLEGVEVIRGKIKLQDYEWQPDIATLVLEIPF